MTEEEKQAAKEFAEALPDDVYDGAHCLMQMWMQYGRYRVDDDLTVVLQHEWIGVAQSATDFLHDLGLCRYSGEESDGAYLTPAGLYVLSPIYLDDEERKRLKIETICRVDTANRDA